MRANGVGKDSIFFSALFVQVIFF